MTIKKWLSNVYYDEFGTHIWNKEKDGGSQLVVDVRGWGRIQNEFKFPKEKGESDIDHRRRMTQGNLICYGIWCFVCHSYKKNDPLADLTVC